jgi:hypothetical protein
MIDKTGLEKQNELITAQRLKTKIKLHEMATTLGLTNNELYDRERGLIKFEGLILRKYLEITQEWIDKKGEI